MLRLGVIEPSESAYSSPLLLVKKADGSFRSCVDVRMLRKLLYDVDGADNYVDDIIIHTNTWAKHVLVLGSLPQVV